MMLVLTLKLEAGRKNIVDHVIQIMPIDEVVALVTGVHGNPAELVATDVVFHVSPNRFSHDWDWFLPWQMEQLSSCVYFYSLPEELTYM